MRGSWRRASNRGNAGSARVRRSKSSGRAAATASCQMARAWSRKGENGSDMLVAPVRETEWSRKSVVAVLRHGGQEAPVDSEGKPFRPVRENARKDWGRKSAYRCTVARGDPLEGMSPVIVYF